MSYLVLARKWRPQSFEDIVGQEHVTRTLKNAIERERVAHAYLFTGARGVGKTSAARILAKALNCEKGPAAEPCNECVPCREISAGNSVDVQEIDGASNTGVDDIRELKESINYLPSRCRKKIYIIDEVHMLSTSAFNALLKTLEEPPLHVIFIFATTEPHKIPGTILSRCQRFDFKRIPLRLIFNRLRKIAVEEGFAVSDTGLMTIAREAEGGMRDAQSLLDQVLSYAGSEISDEDIVDVLGVIDRILVHETVRGIIEKDCRCCLVITERLFAYGWDVKEFGRALLEYFRNLAVAKVAGNAPELIEATQDELESIKSLAEGVSKEDLHLYFDVMAKGMEDVTASFHPKVTLEMLLIKMATLASVKSIDEIISYVASLESSDRTAPPLPRMRVAEGKSAPAAESLVEEYDVSESHHGTERNWSGFVSFVNGKNRPLGSILEHAHLINCDDEIIIAPVDTFSYEKVSDAETMQILRSFCREFFGTEKKIDVQPLPSDVKLANSLHEERKKKESDKSRKLKKEAMEHPMVVESLNAFDGEIEEIRTELNFNE